MTATTKSHAACNNCRFWLRNVAPPDGFGFCQHATHPSKMKFQGNLCESGIGPETLHESVCDGYEPKPVRYRSAS